MLDLKGLVAHLAEAKDCRIRTIDVFTRIVNAVKDGKGVDMSGVSEILTEMQKCVRNDTRLASFLMDH